MNLQMISDNEIAVMKLLHYFIVEENYEPVILHGAQNEIWLENLKGEYQIVRIVSNYLHNDTQYDYDKFRAKSISKQIAHKTFSFKLNILSIYTNLGDNVHLKDDKGIRSLYVENENDLYKNPFIQEYYPDFKDKVNFKEAGFDLFLKISNELNNKNMEDAKKVENVFRKKNPIITYSLIFINIFIFFYFNMSTNYEKILNDFCLSGPIIRNNHEYFRLLTSGFIHLDEIHLFVNMYSLYIIGTQIESYFGKFKYIIIYLVSLLFGGLLSIVLNNTASVGASGAIFGLMGSLLYFGYHYRVYLGSVIKSQIIPLILINLFIGFTTSSIDNFAHIGGLIGGYLISMALGVKYKSEKQDIINGYILTTIFMVFLVYMGIFIER